MQDELVDAALEIVARDGFDALSVRRLGSATHYSPSAVAYYVTPMHRFAGRLWYELHQRVVDVQVGAAAHTDDPTGTGWRRRAERAAAAFLEWADREPRLADFYVTFRPDPDEVTISLDRWGISREETERAGEPLRHHWWYHTHSMQAALERALRTGPGPGRASALAADMVRNARSWREVLAETFGDGRPDAT